MPGSLQHDPMVALDRGSAPVSPIEPLDEAPFRHHPPLSETVNLSGRQTFNGTFRQRSSDMDERQLNDLERSVGEQLEDRWQTPTTQALGHVGADPLLRGMGLDLPFRDSEEQQAFLEEAGQTLRAAVDGLRLLQKAQNDSKYPLRDRRLQPIEDNPLRLGLSFDETAQTLFSAQRSPRASVSSRGGGRKFASPRAAPSRRRRGHWLSAGGHSGCILPPMRCSSVFMRTEARALVSTMKVAGLGKCTSTITGSLTLGVSKAFKKLFLGSLRAGL